MGMGRQHAGRLPLKGWRLDTTGKEKGTLRAGPPGWCSSLECKAREHGAVHVAMQRDQASSTLTALFRALQATIQGHVSVLTPAGRRLRLAVPGWQGERRAAVARKARQHAAQGVVWQGQPAAAGAGPAGARHGAAQAAAGWPARPALAGAVPRDPHQPHRWRPLADLLARHVWGCAGGGARSAIHSERPPHHSYCSTCSRACTTGWLRTVNVPDLSACGSLCCCPRAC